MKYGIQLHARGRQIIECEAYRTRNGKTDVVPMEGYVSHRDRGSIVVIVPKSQSPVKRFSLFDAGAGWGYQGPPSGLDGWRIRLSQLKLNSVTETTIEPHIEGYDRPIPQSQDRQPIDPS